jgi:hypothetical protein
MTLDEKIISLIEKGYDDSSIIESLIREEDGVVTSGDFGSNLPADSRHNWGKTGKELNDESKARLKKFGIVLTRAEDLKEKISVIINRKSYKLQ